MAGIAEAKYTAAARVRDEAHLQAAALAPTIHRQPSILVVDIQRLAPRWAGCHRRQIAIIDARDDGGFYPCGVR